MPTSFFDDRPPIAPTVSASVGQPDKQYDTSSPTGPPDQEVDIKWLEMCLTDAERAEQNFLKRGR